MINLFGKEYDAQEFWINAQTNGHRYSGYYNENYQIDVDGHNCLVRRPIEGADDMDLGFVKEEEVLKLIQNKGINAPKVYAVSDTPYFYVESFIDGDVLNNTHPRGTMVPEHFITDVIDMKNMVWQLDCSSLLRFFPDDWPTGNNVGCFFNHNLRKVIEVWDRFKHKYGSLYTMFGAPENPLEVFEDFHELFTPRPLVLAHSDVHRNNVIINDDKTWFIDWERSLIADPVYDLSVHIHKMYYSPEESKRLIQYAKKVMPEEYIKNIDKDMERYLLLERAKSFIVDGVRAHKTVTSVDKSPNDKEYAVDQYARKISQVQKIWGGRLFDPDEIREKMLSFKPE